MTADRIFDYTLPLVFSEKGDKEFLKSQFVSALNLILAECFELENLLREKKKIAKLTEVPFISEEEISLNIDFDDALLMRVVPYGIAGIIETEDEPSIGISYKNKYEYEKEKLTPVFCCEVLDVY